MRKDNVDRETKEEINSRRVTEFRENSDKKMEVAQQRKIWRKTLKEAKACQGL